MTYREVAVLCSGKTFGELALIRNKPRAATVRCIEDCHFATLDKNDYEISLAKISRKNLNKMLDFMKKLPCFSGWTQNSIFKFSYYLEKVKIQRNKHLYM